MDEHIEELRRLDDLGLLYLEQPLDVTAFSDVLELSEILDTPICLDESLTSDEAARQIVAQGGPVVWNIKVQRVGGLEEACRIYARAGREGARVWGGTMPETGLGAQAMLALGSHVGFVYPSDVEPSERWYAPGVDLIQLMMSAEGMMPVPTLRPAVELGERSRLLHDTDRGGVPGSQ